MKKIVNILDRVYFPIMILGAIFIGLGSLITSERVVVIGLTLVSFGVCLGSCILVIEKDSGGRL